MKILGIDYGEKRIGLAISDESQTLARELDILHPKKFWEQLPKIINEYEIKTIVLGLPLGIAGNDTEKTKEVREFKNRLTEKLNLPVEFIDERFSSAMAKNLPGGKRDIDSLAAQIFLQNYLDKQKN
jgi:putative Holliday junction resolvase